MILVRLTTPFVKLGDYIPIVHSRRELDRENRELRAENDILRQQARALGETGRENLRLSDLVELKRHTNFRTLGARVIGRDTANWWKTIQIDRGSEDGLRENMPVLNADGLIGKTITVTRGESRVLLLLDHGCKVSAFIQDSREPGVVAGMADSFAREPLCRMTFVDRRAKIQQGEAIITSGLGGIFPKGILIGTVIKAQLNTESGMYQDLLVKPAADFRRLEELIVILGNE